MAASIGFRVYKITCHRKGDTNGVSISDPALKISTPAFISQFVTGNGEVVLHDQEERSWFFESRKHDDVGNSKGYVNYGTFGFESNLVSSKTKKTNYRRKADDVEEIPLFYQFSCPEGSEFAFCGFQSFQGRSCITYVMQRFQNQFESANPGFTVRFHKVMPSDVGGSLYYKSSVKNLTLIKRNASSDIADNYLAGATPARVDFEMRMSAGRNRILGSLGAIIASFSQNDAGAVLHEGVSFDEAVAEISVGKRRRRVGVFGNNREAGVIDLSDAIQRGPDGHPTFDSLAKESEAILKDFYSTLEPQGKALT